VHSTLPGEFLIGHNWMGRGNGADGVELLEYLSSPAPRTQYASEFGHLMRVLSIYSRVETILDGLNGEFLPAIEDASTYESSSIASDNVANAASPLVESEQALDVSSANLALAYVY
jgi:hypothetical protein